MSPIGQYYYLFPGSFRRTPNEVYYVDNGSGLTRVDPDWCDDRTYLTRGRSMMPMFYSTRPAPMVPAYAVGGGTMSEHHVKAAPCIELRPRWA